MESPPGHGEAPILPSLPDFASPTPQGHHITSGKRVTIDSSLSALMLLKICQNIIFLLFSNEQILRDFMALSCLWQLSKIYKCKCTHLVKLKIPTNIRIFVVIW
uniref:Ovule protein n=1 Tax=Heterorhabditis bacteriophora TaxID=37862 RepID=A0A1I7WQX6_HETBA